MFITTRQTAKPVFRNKINRLFETYILFSKFGMSKVLTDLEAKTILLLWEGGYVFGSGGRDYQMAPKRIISRCRYQRFNVTN